MDMISDISLPGGKYLNVSTQKPPFEIFEITPKNLGSLISINVKKLLFSLDSALLFILKSYLFQMGQAAEE